MNTTDEQLKQDIKRARAYLRSRFPESQEEELIRTGWIIHWTDIDRARVVPTFLDREIEAGAASYRLTWTRLGLVWQSEGMEVRRAFGLPNICASIPVPD